MTIRQIVGKHNFGCRNALTLQFLVYSYIFIPHILYNLVRWKYLDCILWLILYLNPNMVYFLLKIFITTACCLLKIATCLISAEESALRVHRNSWNRRYVKVNRLMSLRWWFTALQVESRANRLMWYRRLCQLFIQMITVSPSTWHQEITS